MTDIQGLRAVAEAADSISAVYYGAVALEEMGMEHDDAVFFSTFNPALVALLLNIVEAARRYEDAQKDFRGAISTVYGSQQDGLFRALAALSDSATETKEPA